MKRLLAIIVTVAFVFPANQLIHGIEPNPRIPISVIMELLAKPAPAPSQSVIDELPQRRPPDFFSNTTVPQDDAPMDDLLDYWKTKVSDRAKDTPSPSAVTKNRLLEACEADPSNLTDFLFYFEDSDDAKVRVKQIFDAERANPTQEGMWQRQVYDWLKEHSRFYLTDLVTSVSKAKDKTMAVAHEDDIGTLAKLDWPTAAPLLRNLSESGQQNTSTMAITYLYQHAVETGDSGKAEQYRIRLKSIVGDKNSQPGARSIACYSLMKSDWPGRDDWFLSLFKDETLLLFKQGEETSRPLWPPVSEEPDKWVPIIAKLVESKDSTVHNMAVSLLILFQGNAERKDAVLPLLPWLTNPGWAEDTGNDRASLIRSMGSMDIPESIPDLINMVANDSDPDIRLTAATSLRGYKTKDAVPALRRALEKDARQNARNQFLISLAACGGLSDDEAIQGLEAYLNFMSTPDGPSRFVATYRGEAEFLPVPISIGAYLITQNDWTDSLIARAIERVKELDSTNPTRSRGLLSVLRRFDKRVVDLELLRRIRTGIADSTDIGVVLNKRASLLENNLTELSALSDVPGAASGIALVLLQNPAGMEQALDGKDREQQIALLAAARLTGTRLPIEKVTRLFTAKDDNLTLAAERYLEAEDSAEAQTVLRARHPNDVLILGWRPVSIPNDKTFSGRDEFENMLVKEIRQWDHPEMIIAQVPVSGELASVVRIKKDTATYSYYADKSWYEDRSLTDSEVRTFLDYVKSTDLAKVGPLFPQCVGNTCPAGEYLVLTRNGGRRITLITGSQPTPADFHFHSLFHDLTGKAEMKKHYALEKEIKGAELLVADNSFKVVGIDTKDQEVLVTLQIIETAPAERHIDPLTDEDDDQKTEESIRAERVEQTKKRLSMYRIRKLQNGKLSNESFDPSSDLVTENIYLWSEEEGFYSARNRSIDNARIGDGVVMARAYKDSGLWKVTDADKPERISKEGQYEDPIVTADKKWVIAAKHSTDYNSPLSIVRINLDTHQEYEVDVPAAYVLEAITILPTQGKVLLYRSNRNLPYINDKIGPATPEVYLLDPQTGKTELVKGEFAPLVTRSSRQLQPTGQPDEIWAAIPNWTANETKVGRYNLRSFAFKPTIVIPHIIFSSFDTVIDEKEGKIYVVYHGHLLRLPLSSETAKSS